MIFLKLNFCIVNILFLLCILVLELGLLLYVGIVLLVCPSIRGGPGISPFGCLWRFLAFFLAMD